MPLYLEGKKVRDMRKYASQTNFRLVVGVVVLFFIVGDGLIYLLYGKSPAFMGLLCLSGAMLPVLIIILVLWLLDWLAVRNNR